MPIFSKPVTELLQLRVLCLGLLKDWNIWIGVFPQRHKFLVRHASLGDIALELVGATQLEMRQRPDGFIRNDAAMIEDFLKLCRRFAALTRGKIGFSSYIYRIQVGPVVKANCGRTEFIRSSELEITKRLLGI